MDWGSGLNEGGKGVIHLFLFLEEEVTSRPMLLSPWLELHLCLDLTKCDGLFLQL